MVLVIIAAFQTVSNVKTLRIVCYVIKAIIIFYRIKHVSNVLYKIVFNVKILLIVENVI